MKKFIIGMIASALLIGSADARILVEDSMIDVANKPAQPNEEEIERTRLMLLGLNDDQKNAFYRLAACVKSSVELYALKHGVPEGGGAFTALVDYVVAGCHTPWLTVDLQQEAEVLYINQVLNTFGTMAK